MRQYLFISLGFLVSAAYGASDTIQQCRTAGRSQIFGDDDYFSVDCAARNGVFEDCYVKLNVADHIEVTQVTLYQDGIHPGAEKKHKGLTVSMHTLWLASRCGTTTGYTSDFSQALPALKELISDDIAVKERGDCTIQYDARITAPKDKDARFWELSKQSRISCTKNDVMFRFSPRVQGVTAPSYLEITEPKKRKEKIRLTDCSLESTFTDVENETVTKCTSGSKLSIQADGSVKMEELNKLDITFPAVVCEFGYGTPRSESVCMERGAKALTNAFAVVLEKLSK